MNSKQLFVLMLAVGFGFAMGYFSRPHLGALSVHGTSETELLAFDSNVRGYNYSEKGVIGIKKVDDRNYAIKAVRPGMCVIEFWTSDTEKVPLHARRGRFIVLVSANKELTIQETKYTAGGML